MNQVAVRLKMLPEGMASTDFLAWKYESGKGIPVWVIRLYHASSSDPSAPLRALHAPDLPLGGWIVGVVSRYVNLESKIEFTSVIPAFVYNDDAAFYSEFEAITQ